MNAIELLLLTNKQKERGIWLGHNNDSEYKEWYEITFNRLYVHRTWKDGRAHGEEKMWSFDGRLISHELYAYGIKVKILK